MSLVPPSLRGSGPGWQEWDKGVLVIWPGWPALREKVGVQSSPAILSFLFLSACPGLRLRAAHPGRKGQMSVLCIQGPLGIRF